MSIEISPYDFDDDELIEELEGRGYKVNEIREDKTKYTAEELISMLKQQYCLDVISTDRTNYKIIVNDKKIFDEKDIVTIILIHGL